MFIFLLGNFLIFSGKAIFRIIFSCGVGWLSLGALNLLLSTINLHLGINAISVLIAGILGLPGIALLGIFYI